MCQAHYPVLVVSLLLEKIIKHQLQLYLVQEGCFWFKEITNKVPFNISTEV